MGHFGAEVRLLQTLTGTFYEAGVNQSSGEGVLPKEPP